MTTPGLAQTVVYDGSSSNPNPAPGTTINNGNGHGAFFRRADPPSDTVGDAGDATINDRGGSTVFTDDSTANAATINNSNNGKAFFNDDSTAGHATINNGQDGTTWFSHQSTAGDATIGNLGTGARTIVEDTATAGAATITNRDDGSTQLVESSTAGQATITNQQNGTTTFSGQSTAGHSTIDNRSGGSTEFLGVSTAGSATITNNNGQTSFRGDSTAGGAAIASVNEGKTTFFDRSSAGAAIITADGGGVFNNKTGIFFQGTSTAGAAGIDISNGGIAVFDDNSTAAAATINSDRSTVSFAGTATAGSAVINLKNSGSAQFFEGSTAGNATINNSATTGIGFNADSTAGNATINNNQGIVVFGNNSTAGDARLINGDGNSRVDFSGTTGTAGDGKITAGSIAGGGTFFLGGNQLTVGGNGASTTVSGVIADGGVKGGAGGSLVKTGGGTLTLTGANTYTGGTELHGGVLSVSADANLGATSGGLVFSGGTLATTASFVTARGMSVQQSGTLDVAGGTALGLTGAVSGTGNLFKTGAGVLVYDGNGAGFAGNTDIAAGALIVGSSAGHRDAVLGGSTTVLSGGILAGHGTVGSGAGSVVTIGAGGILAPGNSAGTLTVNGDLAMDAGSHLVAEIDAAGADRVAVSGAGDITGAVLDVSGQGVRAGRYTIVTAAGGLTGTFGSVTGTGPISSFLGITNSYDANNAYLDVLRVRDFADAGLTRNQKATAAGVQSLSGDDPLYAGSPLYDAILHLSTDAAARDAFDQVSGEVHASAKTALIEDSRFLRDAVDDRIRAAFDGVGATGGTAVTYENGLLRLASANTDRFALWGQGFGSWGHTGSDGNAARLDRSTGGLLLGFDARVVDTWRLGLVAGYSRTDFEVRDRVSSGASDNYHLGLYGGTRWGALGFRTGLAYTWHDIYTNRSVAFPGFVDSLKSNYRAGTFQAFGDLGYRVDTAAASFEPFANLAYVSLNTDGFTEQGAAALRSDGQATNTTFATLGLRASSNISLGGVNVTARGSLGWRHAFGDASPLSTQAFSAGDAFTVAGVPIARDAAVIETGLDLAVTRAVTVGVSYNGQLASSARQHAFKANLNVKF
ncbi:MAG: autotransporter domain-containing protein [Alphaproteobacteria bacterium]|nr:autotransporter domain-containing protein [Alphaproteobacteria bacterium]